MVSELLAVTSRGPSGRLMRLAPSASRRSHGGDDFHIDIVRPGLAFGGSDHGLGPLGGVDHARVRPGVVVAMHPHRNDEILTYLRSGTVLHEDTSGYKTEINSHRLMLMNAGSGLMHEETNVGGTDVTGLQIFVRPEVAELTPRVQFHDFGEVRSENEWRLIAGPETAGAPLVFRSAVTMFDQRLTSASTTLPELGGKTGFFYVVSGSVTVSPNLKLGAGDGLVIEGETPEVQHESDADLVLFVVDRSAPFTRAGAFSG